MDIAEISLRPNSDITAKNAEAVAMEARARWAHALVYLTDKQARREVGQMMIDAMDSKEQTDLEYDLNDALRSYIQKV